MAESLSAIHNSTDAHMTLPIPAAELCASRLPPFGRDVLAYVAAGKQPNVFVFATIDAWNRARRRRAAHGLQSAMLLPPGDAPVQYRWPYVPGGVIVVAVGQPRRFALELARVIVSWGTPVVAAVFGSSDLLIVRSRRWGKVGDAG